MTDEFDFFDELIPQSSQKKEEDAYYPRRLSFEEQIRTSYLLVNTLLNLLLEKGIIHEDEVNSLVNELYKEYRYRRG